MQGHLLMHDRNEIVIQVEKELITSWARLLIVMRLGPAERQIMHDTMIGSLL